MLPTTHAYTVSRCDSSVLETPTDNDAYRFPVSVKGVIMRADRVVLLKNERDQWELPGGKLELGETPQRCLTREIAEELQLCVDASRLLDAWVYCIAPEIRVLIVTYGCTETAERAAVLSDEHKQLGWFPPAAVETLNMPAGYKASIHAWAVLNGRRC